MTVYRALALFEIGINIKGNFYLVIYGRHANGYFCCIPNWGIGCEMAEANDTFYNTERLVGAGFAEDTASAVAKAIKEYKRRVKV